MPWFPDANSGIPLHPIDQPAKKAKAKNRGKEKPDTHYHVRCALDLLYAGRVDEATEKLLPLIGWTGTLEAWNEHQKGIRS